ncbi:MAG: protein kinase [Verrucomicrobiales bacterium]|nr:protein kinase [Verrucomicrobiales bacterium]
MSSILPSSLGSSDGRTRFGDYELVEEIARGGAGVVYRARQRSLNRVVALKMLLFGGGGDPDRIRRFRVEATTAASLNHPNIVRVLDIGEHNGQPYLAMELVDGSSLDGLIRDRPLAPERAARYVERAARAIAFAHERGVLHRDLKPSNVLVDSFDEPRITDFGLARHLNGGSELTITGQALGTPNFMPPEQVAGDLSRLGPASDVYGLGTILYALLTTRPPFLAGSVEATLAAVCESEPVPLRQLNGQVPRDLETICLKCLEKDPAKRYPTALELAGELECFQRGEPILARPVTRSERAWRWCQRKPALASIGLLAASLLLLLGVGGPIAAYRINQARATAMAEAGRAQRSLYASDMLLAFQALENNNRGRVRALLEKHRLPAGAEIGSPNSGTEDARAVATSDSRLPADLRGWEWRYLWSQTLSDELHTLTLEPNRVWRVAWSAKGDRIATAGAIPGTNATRVKVWGVAERRELRRVDVPVSVSELRFLGRDELLVIGARDLAIYLWNSATGRATEIPTDENSLGAVTLAGDGRTLAATGTDWVGIWDLESGQRTASTHSPGILVANDRAIALSADGHRLAYNNFLGTFANSQILLAESTSATTLANWSGHKDRIERLEFSPDGKWIASGSLDGAVKLWDTEGRALRFELSGHTAAISAMAFSPDGQRLATGGWDQRILVWNVATGERLGRLQGHTQVITSLAFSPGGERICSSSRDGSVRVWSAEIAKALPIVLTNEPPVFASEFAPGADGFWTFDGGDAITTWNPTEMSETGTFHTPESWAAKFRTGPGGLIAIQLTNNHVAVYATSPLRLLSERQESTNSVRALAFSLDGQRVAIARDEWPERPASTVDVWDWKSEKSLSSLQLRPQRVAGMGFSRDAALIGIGYQDGWIEIWRLADSRRVAAFQGTSEWANRILFLSDQRRVVCASSVSGFIRIWDLVRETEAASLSGQVTAYTQISESMDGCRLAGGGGDGTITIWDLESYAEVATLRGHKDPVLSMAFLPDGDTLVSISRESKRIWRATPVAQTDGPRKSK